MGNKPLSGENAAATLAGTAVYFDGIQDGANVKVSKEQVREYLLTGPVGIGMTAVDWLDLTNNQNALTRGRLCNNSSGASAGVEWKLDTTTAVGGCRLFGPSYSGGASDLANFVQVYSSGSVMLKSTFATGEIRFYTNDTTEIGRMTVDNGGALLIGSTVVGATEKFRVTQPDAAELTAYMTNANATPGAANILTLAYSGASPDNNTAKFLSCTDSTTERLRIYSDGDVQNHDNSYGAISGAAIKQNIRDANSQWADVKAYRFRNYKFIADVEAYGDEARELLGVIAEELVQTSPGLVREDPVFEEVVTPGRTVITKEKRQKVETVSVPIKEILEVDGKLIVRERIGEEQRPVFAEVALYNEDGTVRDEVLRVPVMEEVDVEAAIPATRELRQTGTQKRVIYSILCLKAVKALQEAMTRIEVLEQRLGIAADSANV